MSSQLSESMEQILDRFEDAWNGPSPPSIEDYLRACEPAKRRPLLIELIYIDLERRLVAGEPVRVEECYLRCFAELNEDRAAIVALAAREFELRRRREPNLSVTEYLERWPDYRDELGRLLYPIPTLPTQDDESRDNKAAVDGRQASEETSDVVALLASPQAADEMGRLGGYRVLQVLGSGSMGVVLLAEDAQLQRLVALKIMRPILAVHRAARQRFLREARAVAALKHDRIITIYQVGEDRGVPFLAMDYLEGETLHDRLKRETTLPLAVVLRLGIEIAEGLAAAHVRGLIHRDIKPANIWLEQRSEPRPSGSGAFVSTCVKLLDFGLASAASGDETQLTQSGVIIGTPAFMSPEQARGEKVDARSDLFSLGCVLYRMVTGELPFKGRDVMSTLLSLAKDHPKPPRELNPQVPPALDDLIQRLLSKNIVDRPSSAQSVAKQLQTLPLESPPVSPSPSPRTDEHHHVEQSEKQRADAHRSTAPSARAMSRRRSLPTPVSCMGLILVLFSLALNYFFFRYYFDSPEDRLPSKYAEVDSINNIVALGAIAPRDGILSLGVPQRDRIKQVKVKEDEVVQKGQILVVLDSEESVVAPRDGKILHIFFQEGELVDGKPILQMVNVDNMIVLAEVDEKDVQRVKPGQSVLISSPSKAFDSELTGKVVWIANNVGKAEMAPLDPRAAVRDRAVYVKVAVDQPQCVAKLIGLQVQVRITTREQR